MFLSKAVKYGLRKEDVKHKHSLYSYMETLKYDDDGEEITELVIYHHYIVVLGRRQPNSELVGITILCLPRQYFVVVDGMKRKGDKNERPCKKKRPTKSRKPEREDYSYSR